MQPVVECLSSLQLLLQSRPEPSTLSSLRQLMGHHARSSKHSQLRQSTMLCLRKRKSAAFISLLISVVYAAYTLVFALSPSKYCKSGHGQTSRELGEGRAWGSRNKSRLQWDKQVPRTEVVRGEYLASRPSRNTGYSPPAQNFLDSLCLTTFSRFKDDTSPYRTTGEPAILRDPR